MFLLRVALGLVPFRGTKPVFGLIALANVIAQLDETKISVIFVTSKTVVSRLINLFTQIFKFFLFYSQIELGNLEQMLSGILSFNLSYSCPNYLSETPKS